MATGRMDYYSNCLGRNVTFRFILPTDAPEDWKKENAYFQRPMKTLLLLHGFSGSCDDWFSGSAIQELASLYNLAVICPTGENSFYLDGPETGRKYGTFVGEELMGYARKTFGLSEDPADTFVGGLSMGGFGAIHTGLAYPHTFSKIFALSSALIVHNIERMKPGDADPMANYDYYKLVFGELENLSSSPNNPEEQIRRLKQSGTKIPEIYMACGTEDFLINENHLFRDFLKEQNVPFHYCEDKGIHNWAFWNQFLEPAIQWLLEI